MEDLLKTAIIELMECLIYNNNLAMKHEIIIPEPHSSGDTPEKTSTIFSKRGKQFKGMTLGLFPLPSIA